MPDDVDARMLDQDVRRELRGLTRETADLVARHLVMTGRLLDDDPERALAHAQAARAMAGRIGVVREAAGLAAYAAGEWTEALAELRAARRITGAADHLAVMADCERALERPERALAYADDPSVGSLTQDQRVELVIVVSGARRDLGQADAAVLVLQDPARRTTAARPWAARLWYAYADALLDAGRLDEARNWFEQAAAVDDAGATDAGDRVLELDGVVLEDLDEDEETGAGLPDAELAAFVAFVAEAFPHPAPSAAAPAEPDGPEPAGGAQTAVAPAAAAAAAVAPAAVAGAGVAPAAVAGEAGPAAPADDKAEQDRPRRSGAPRLPAAGFTAIVPPSAAPEPVRSASSLIPLFASPPPVEEDGTDDD